MREHGGVGGARFRDGTAALSVRSAATSPGGEEKSRRYLAAQGFVPIRRKRCGSTGSPSIRVS